MTPETQTWAAVGVVVLAAAGLVWRAIRRWRRRECGDGGCACPTRALKR